MSNPNKIHYSKGYTSLGGLTFNPKTVIFCILIMFSLFAVYKYGQFAAEKNFNMKSTNYAGKQKVDLLSWKPRVFYHHSFISTSEIEYFKKYFKNATLSNPERSKVTITEKNTFLDDLDKRIARFTQMPVSHYDYSFITKYEVGYESEAHRDWFADDEKELSGSRGNRVATFIVFLSDVSGGEIYFPKINLQVTPQVGDAILIWNLSPDHKIEESALYGIKKITANNLFTLTKFLREKA